MNRAFVNVLTDDVEESAQFYETLLGLTRHADFGWFTILTHRDMPGYELGILDRQHDTVPTGVAARPGGTILTFVVEDVSEPHARATAMGAPIVEPLRDLPYGQRRLLLRAPEGTMVDISSPTPA